MAENKGKTEKKRLSCPYCDKDVAELQYPYCDACGVEVFFCPECQKPLPRGSKNCPSCGAEVKDQQKC